MHAFPGARFSRRAHLALGLALSCAAGVAHAAWPPDPLINVPLCATAYSSQVSAAVPDGGGGAIVAWYEDRAGDFDVFARRVDQNGTPLWAANGVLACSTTVGTPQVLPKAVSDGAGGVILVWIDGRAGANALYAQRLDASGVRQWGNAGVLAASSTSNQVTEFDVVSDGTGGVVVAWATPLSGISSDLYAQRYNSAGALQWGTNAKAVCTEKSDQFRPVLVRRASNTFVVAWEDQRQPFRTNLYGQALNATGVTQWAVNGVVLASSAQNAINPMLVATGTTDCLLFWDADSLGVGSVRGQRIGSAGTPLWAGAGLTLFSRDSNGLLGVTTDQVGGAYVVTNRTEPTTGKNPLWAQRIQDTGILLFPPAGLRVSSIPSDQTQLTLAPDNAGGLLLGWYDDQRGLSPNADIIAQRLSAFGDAQWSPSGVPVCRAPNQGPGLLLEHNGSGGAVLAWSDTRNTSSPDIYVQGVDAAGRLGSGVAVPPAAAPTAVALARPAPNPLPRGSASLSYTLTTAERVELRVVDASGRVMTVLESGPREAGTHTLAWDGRARGQRLPPGLYLVQLLTPSRSEIRRLVLL